MILFLVPFFFFFFFFLFKLLEVVKLILCLLFDEALMVKENGQEVVQYQEQN
jgi:hypothetical protein